MESRLVTQNLYRADYELEVIILTTLLFFLFTYFTVHLTTLIEILQSN